MFKLKKWEDLPLNMQRDEVYSYYLILKSKSVQLFIKRLFDLVFGIILGILLSPIIIIIAIIIKCTSPGTVFFTQDRVTTNGKIFKILKFRTMSMDAEKNGAQVTKKNDPRITSIGHKLRKYRLDELPQIFNVIKGEMSFVGTRPEVLHYVEDYTPEMMSTLLLPAGITSKASIAYRNEEELLNKSVNVDIAYIYKILPKKMEYNLTYIKKFNLFYDMLIMLETLASVLIKEKKKDK